MLFCELKMIQERIQKHHLLSNKEGDFQKKIVFFHLKRQIRALYSGISSIAAENYPHNPQYPQFYWFLGT